ncbi:MAG: TetR/AcrR family transcriptional regulator [Nannocystales bacterium]
MDDKPTDSARDRLLRAGARLFAQSGFDGVSVRAICSEAGTSNNMIHHYFGSKQGLLNSIVDNFTDELFALPLRVLERKVKSVDDFILRMELFFEQTLLGLIDQRDVIRVVQRHDIAPPAMRDLNLRFVQFLERCQEHGYLRQGIEPALISGLLMDRLINQVLHAPMILRTTGCDLIGDTDYRERWIRTNLDVLLFGLVSENA